jgi:hypothetical protein
MLQAFDHQQMATTKNYINLANPLLVMGSTFSTIAKTSGLVLLVASCADMPLLSRTVPHELPDRIVSDTLNGRPALSPPRRGERNAELERYAAQIGLEDTLRKHNGIVIPKSGNERTASIFLLFRSEDNQSVVEIVQGQEHYQDRAFKHNGKDYLWLPQFVTLLIEKRTAGLIALEHKGATLGQVVTPDNAYRIARKRAVSTIAGLRSPQAQQLASAVPLPKDTKTSERGYVASSPQVAAPEPKPAASEPAPSLTDIVAPKPAAELNAPTLTYQELEQHLQLGQGNKILTGAKFASRAGPIATPLPTASVYQFTIPTNAKIFGGKSRQIIIPQLQGIDSIIISYSQEKGFFDTVSGAKYEQSRVAELLKNGACHYVGKTAGLRNAPLSTNPCGDAAIDVSSPERIAYVISEMIRHHKPQVTIASISHHRQGAVVPPASEDRLPSYYATSSRVEIGRMHTPQPISERILPLSPSSPPYIEATPPQPQPQEEVATLSKPQLEGTLYVFYTGLTKQGTMVNVGKETPLTLSPQAAEKLRTTLSSAEYQKLISNPPPVVHFSKLWSDQKNFSLYGKQESSTVLSAMCTSDVLNPQLCDTVKTSTPLMLRLSYVPATK